LGLQAKSERSGSKSLSAELAQAGIIDTPSSALDLLSPPDTSSSTVESAAARLTNGSNDVSSKVKSVSM